MVSSLRQGVGVNDRARRSAGGKGGGAIAKLVLGLLQQDRLGQQVDEGRGDRLGAVIAKPSAPRTRVPMERFGLSGTLLFFGERAEKVCGSKPEKWIDKTLIPTTHTSHAAARCPGAIGGGIGGTKWVPPLLPKDFAAAVDLRWLEYIQTTRGEEWWIPTPASGSGAGDPL
jgi:hypothetical protein